MMNPVAALWKLLRTPLKMPEVLKPKSYWRVNFLVVSAYVIVISCLWIVIMETTINEFAKGVVTMILSKYLSHIDNMFNFEFGVTRTEQAKDQQIKELAKDVVPAPNLPPGTVVTTSTPPTTETRVTP